MTKLLWILLIFSKLTYGCNFGAEALKNCITGTSMAELRHQLGPEAKTNTFALSDPLPEERVEILNFLQPNWDKETAETLKEMIWKKDQGHLVIWLRQKYDSWYAFHHSLVCLDQ